MRAVVFSTFRQVRDFIAAHDNTLLPKLYTMQEFMERCVVVPGRVFVDEASRVLYLYRAIEGLEIEKLGFERNFLSFVKNSEFIFRFFEELHAERVDIASLRRADTYADFEDHLSLLEAIYRRYNALLEAEGLVDRVGVDDYRLAERFLAGFERIDIHVDGFLSRFELEVLGRIETPLFLHFPVTPYNRKLVERLGVSVPMHSEAELRLQTGEVVSCEAAPPLRPAGVETAAFEERIDQVAFVLKKVADFVEAGADPDRIAVVLPDEEFAEYLKLFDTCGNFNYAMGTPFTQSRYYRLLADLYDALTGRSAAAAEKMAGHPVAEAFEKVRDFDTFMAFLKGLETDARELKAIDEVTYLFATYRRLLARATPLQLLHTWLQRLENLRIDDVGGGKITVMGVLESRGQRFDGVVVVDFNEERVPKVGEKDIFLNSAIRRHAGMPTRSDKENLQKNYYYRLLQNSRMAALCWVKNEEAAPSRFLAEMGFGDKDPEGARYRPILAPDPSPPARYDAVPEGPNPFLEKAELTPTKLKDRLVCPRRFYYRYVLGIKEPPDKSDRSNGTLIHAALEEAVRAKESFDTAEAYFAFVVDRLHRRAASSLQRFDLVLEWEERLRNFCREDFARLKGSEQQVERWCDTPFEGFRLSAKVDRIDVTEDRVRLIDYKTSSRLKETLEDENDFQLLFYTLWAKATYPDKEAEACYYDLYEGKVRHRDTAEELGRLRKILAELKAAPTVAYAMTEELSACRFCLYKEACGR